MTDSPDTPAATQVASRLLVENMRASAEEIRARYVARKSEYPADWQAAAGEVFSVAHVTPDELDRLRAQVLEIMAPYVRLEPASRPGRRAAGQRVARPVPVVRARGDRVTAAKGRLAAGWRSGPPAARKGTKAARDRGSRRSGADQEVTAPARSASMMASVTSAVPAVPPTSRVRWPAAVVASIAASTRRASSCRPR